MARREAGLVGSVGPFRTASGSAVRRLLRHGFSLLTRLSTIMTGAGAAASADVRRLSGEEPPPLPWLLRRVNQRYRLAIRESLAKCGYEELPQPGYWALMVLARGGTDAGRLMREMGVSKQAVSKLVDTLVGTGFVDRGPNEADRRRTDLSLTAKGRQATRVIGDAVRGTDKSFVAELGAEPFADFVQKLAQLARRED